MFDFLQHGFITLDDESILNRRITREERLESIALHGIVPSLVEASKICTSMDLGVQNLRRPEEERIILGSLDTKLRNQLYKKLTPRSVVFTPSALMQYTKEIISHAADTGSRPTLEDIFRYSLSINREQNTIEGLDLGSLPNPSVETFQDLHQKHLIEELAIRSFNRTGSVQELMTFTTYMWLKEWPKTPRTKKYSQRPADVFSEVMGFDHADFLAVGWCVCTDISSGMPLINCDDLLARGLPEMAVNFFFDRFSIDIETLRSNLLESTPEHQDTHEEIAHLPWMKAEFQRFPLIRFSDKWAIAVRLQYVAERFFGHLPIQDVAAALAIEDAAASENFLRAIDDVFERRVGESFKRSAENSGGSNRNVVGESQMNSRWKKRTGKSTGKSKNCDWAFSSGSLCLVSDANNRSLRPQISEGTGSFDQFNKDLMNNLVEHKFTQLISTIEKFQLHGWNEAEFKVTPKTTFIPIVIVPDNGIILTELIDQLLIKHSQPNFNIFGSKVTPPAVLSWNDLVVLEGISDKYGVDIVEVLGQWRWTVVTPRAPLGLPDFVTLHDFLLRRWNDRPISREITHEITDTIAVLEKRRSSYGKLGAR